MSYPRFVFNCILAVFCCISTAEGVFSNQSIVFEDIEISTDVYIEHFEVLQVISCDAQEMTWRTTFITAIHTFVINPEPYTAWLI